MKGDQLPRLKTHFEKEWPKNKTFKSSEFVKSFNKRYPDNITKDKGSWFFTILRKNDKIVKLGKCYWMLKGDTFKSDVWLPKDEDGTVITYEILIKELERVLERDGIDYLNQDIPRGYLSGVTREYAGVTRVEMGRALKELRIRKRAIPVKIKTENEMSNYKSLQHAYDIGNTNFRQSLVDCRMIRSSPKEKNANIKIGRLLTNTVPKGGSGILMGSPTAICASQDSMSKNLIIDNTGVATALLFSTDYMRIVVGNIIDPEKATLKVAQWKNLDLFRDIPVEDYPLDARGFYDKVTEMITAGNKFLKVVFLSSGVWYGKNEKRFDANFHDAAMELSRKHSGLHLLTMVRSHPGFNIHYINKGKTKVYKTN